MYLTLIKAATNHDAFQRGIISARVLTEIVPTQFGPHLTNSLLDQFNKFFDTKPNQINDELLLLKILNFSNIVLEKGAAGSTFIKWLVTKLDDINCPLYEYISNTSNIPGGDSRVKRTIIRSFLNLVIRLVKVEEVTMTIFQFTVTNLLNRINQSRSGDGSDHFYNLPVIQICVRAFSRLSVDRTGKFRNLADLWSPINRGLIEIVTAFYRGSGGSTQSFMGKRNKL